MQIYYSQLCCLDCQPAQAVDRLVAAGATNVELMLDGMGWRDFHKRLPELAHELAAKPVQYAVHVPVWDANLTCENELISQSVLEGYRQSIELAKLLHASHVVVHPGFCQATCFDKDAARERARLMLDELLSFARPSGIPILIENVGSNESSLYTMSQYVDYCNSLPDNGGALIDIGHAHINGWDIVQMITQLGTRLRALHIHDNSADYDSHNPIGSGTVDWQAIAHTVKQLGLAPSLILEYSPSYTEHDLQQGSDRLRQLFN